MKLRDRAVEKFEQHLDIRSFVSVNTNLTLLIWLLLSKEQLVLFQHHHKRAIKQKAPCSTSSESEEPENPLKKMPKLKLGSKKGPKHAEKKLAELLGYPALSNLDQKLLLGVFHEKLTKSDKKSPPLD